MEEKAFQIPDPYMFNNETGNIMNWCKLSKDIKYQNENYPWDARLNKAFWHGGPTGGHRNLLGYQYI